MQNDPATKIIRQLLVSMLQQSIAIFASPHNNQLQYCPLHSISYVIYKDMCGLIKNCRSPRDKMRCQMIWLLKLSSYYDWGGNNGLLEASASVGSRRNSQSSVGFTLQNAMFSISPILSRTFSWTISMTIKWQQSVLPWVGFTPGCQFYSLSHFLMNNYDDNQIATVGRGLGGLSS